jgi:hypothetical protein
MGFTNADILNGSQLIVEFTPDGGAKTVTAFSTSHSFNITTSQEDVLTKEYGKYPGKIIGTVEWEVTCENLAGDDTKVSSITKLMDAFSKQASTGKPVSLIFGQIAEADWNEGKGTMGSNGELTEFTGVQTPILSGQAIITSLSMNAAAGENATISATFTGVGAPDWGDSVNPTPGT